MKNVFYKIKSFVTKFIGVMRIIIPVVLKFLYYLIYAILHISALVCIFLLFGVVIVVILLIWEIIKKIFRDLDDF